ncbi:hypothetical protein BLS_007748 [Venturia inaequalis]|uniref:SCA7 domain-containing protein n=1 Tax=Venturia inaequalis TaxID=5025 RepID=A0A8H3YPV3_VENIN|nr:hypothetical protein BLS_007748 [Venturia inaequalis]
MSSTANGARKGRNNTPKPTVKNGTHANPTVLKNSTDRRKYTRLGLIDPSKYDTVFADEDKKPLKLKAKGALAKQSTPGIWSGDNAVTGAKGKRAKEKDTEKDGKDTTAIEPLMKPLDDKIAAAFPSGRPFEDSHEMVNCKHCKRPVLRSAAGQHIKDCLKKKQEKLQKKKEAKEAKDAAIRKEKNGGVSPAPEAEEGADPKRARKTALDLGDGTAKKSSKKRKADDEPKGASAKKKKKEDTKAKAAKAKGPVDVEKQCGVILSNGALCARSLTCKSHSMGAKRSVPGRSAPYDLLLAQYQKKNQAKQQRAAIDANAPLADEFEDAGKIDSDEEREAVMAAVSRSYHNNPYTGSRLAGAPMNTFSLVAPVTKYKYHRMKDALRNALSGENGRHLFATPASQAASAGLFGTGGAGLDSAGLHSAGLQSAGLQSSGLHDGLDHNRRASSVTAGRQNTMLPQSRKPSISAQMG